MNGRSVLLIASGTVLGAVAVLALDPQKKSAFTPTERPQVRAAGAGELPRDRTVVLPLASTPEHPPTSAPDTPELDRLRGRLRDVQTERTSLEAQVKALESKVAQQAGSKGTRRATEFDLTADDWKKLAAKGRIKYRVPCLLSPEKLAAVRRPEYDELGLSPDEQKEVTAAHIRSYERVWGTLRPLCLQTVNNPSVVDLLGPANCLSLLEKVESEKDLSALWDARRQVGEVRGGIRVAPEAGQSQHPMYTAYMALTGEGELFKADLAENFGPDEAERIWQGLRCENSAGGDVGQ